MLIISSVGSAISMSLFIYFESIYLLGVLGLFLFASGPVLMASVQDTNSHMPTFMNSMYMSINFGVSSIMVFGVGFLGDMSGLYTTYIVCNVVAIGCIPMAFLINSNNQSLKE